MTKYIPQSLRNHLPQQKIDMPERSKLNGDKALLRYHREILLLYIDLAVDTSERILDCEIPLFERLNVQSSQNELYKMSEVVKASLSKETEEMHEDRVAFTTEIIALTTLVKPKFYKKMQDWFQQIIKNMHSLK